MMNVPYVLLRLLRRSFPSWMAYRLLSNDRLPASFLADRGRLYLNTLSESGVSAKGKRVVEIGPGTYNPASLAFLGAGAARVTLMEPFPRPFDSKRLEERLARFFDLLEPRPTMAAQDVFHNGSFREPFARFVRAGAERTTLPNESEDLIVSQSVLEHIRTIPDVFLEQFRILHKGGSLLHIIDFRDHLFRYPFEMLTFSPFMWEKVLTSYNKGGGYQNRLRLDDYIALLEKAGFRNIRYNILGTDIENFRKVAGKLHPAFRNKEEKMLTITTAAITAQKA